MTPTISFLTCWEAELGWSAFALSYRGLAALTFGHPDHATANLQLQRLLTRHRFVIALECQPEVESAPIQFLRERLDKFMAGQKIEFDPIALDLTGLTPFQRDVVQACREIPWSEHCTYGELARRVGRPRAARAVGSVMAHNRFPLVVPCHRVLGSSGKLVGFSAPQGLAMKRRLLAAEQLWNGLTDELDPTCCSAAMS